MSYRLALAGLLALGTAAAALPAHAEFSNGLRLARICHGRQSAEHSACEGYIAGVLDQAGRDCPRDLKLKELRDIVEQYALAHRDEVRTSSGRDLVLRATAARCGK